MIIKTYFQDNAYPYGGLMSQYFFKLKLGETIKIRGPFGRSSYYGDGRFEIMYFNLFKKKNIKAA